jgi:hypothetical protein
VKVVFCRSETRETGGLTPFGTPFGALNRGLNEGVFGPLSEAIQTECLEGLCGVFSLYIGIWRYPRVLHPSNESSRRGPEWGSGMAPI